MDAMSLQRLSHRLYLQKMPILPGIINRWIHFRYNSDLSPVTEVGKGTRLGHGGIGVVVNSRAKIGRNCILGQNTSIAGKDGGTPTLGDWVYVGHGSIVLGEVNIGNNVFIGALSLVNKDIPDNAIVAGIPAKVIRIKTDEEVENWHQWVLNNGGEPIQ